MRWGTATLCVGRSAGNKGACAAGADPGNGAGVGSGGIVCCVLVFGKVCTEAETGNIRNRLRPCGCGSAAGEGTGFSR